MMLLTLWLAVLTAVLFWAGFVAKRHEIRGRPLTTWRYRSRRGFAVGLVLLGVSGYFAWRQARSLSELAAIIDPVPEITDAPYVPTPGEVEAFARVIAAAPNPRTSLGRTEPEDRRALARAAGTMRTRYWLLTTARSVEEAAAFCRDAAARRGWTVETAASQWLRLSKGGQRLTIFISDDWPRPGTRVLYALSAPGA